MSDKEVQKIVKQATLPAHVKQGLLAEYNSHWIKAEAAKQNEGGFDVDLAPTKEPGRYEVKLGGRNGDLIVGFMDAIFVVADEFKNDETDGFRIYNETVAVAGAIIELFIEGVMPYSAEKQWATANGYSFTTSRDAFGTVWYVEFTDPKAISFAKISGNFKARHPLTAVAFD